MQIVNEEVNVQMDGWVDSHIERQITRQPA